MTTRFSRGLLVALALLPAASQAQSLLLDNFNYAPGTALTANGWTATSAAGSNPVTVTANNLTLQNYPATSGNAVALAVPGTSNEDVTRPFTAPVTTGTVYGAALVNVTSAQASGDYFFHFSSNATTFAGRVFARSATGGVQFGISKTGTFTTAVFGTTTYALGTTCLIVLKYEFTGAAGTDDPVSLFVFASGDPFATEPATPVATFTTGNDLASVVGVNLRQGGNTVGPTLTLDGIRVGRTWNDAVLATQTVDDGAGYRLLGAPVGGVTVGALAGINLVQGVAGQYPNAADNLFTSYNASTGYVGATSTAEALAPGRGFFWYLYDQNLSFAPTAAGGGTSQSYTVPERPLFASGAVNTADVAAGFPTSADGFYLTANPFAQSLAATGVTQTAGGGTFSTMLQAYEPSTSSFVFIDRTTATNLSMWQGFFAEVAGATDPTFTYLAASRTDALTPLVSRAAVAAGLAFTLDGQTAAGATHDEAAIVRIDAAASAGWDAGDASKLTPPGATYALVAPVGTRDGQARRQAVLSLPAMQDVVLAFTTTTAGTFTLTATATGLPAEATVRDLATGATARLADGLTFSSEATGWTERFVVTMGRTTAGEGAPASFSLGSAFPNPATAAARIALRVDAAQTVTATVVDALGRTVQTAFAGALAAGQAQEIAVDTAGLAPGVYVVRVTGETFAATRRLVVAR